MERDCNNCVYSTRDGDCRKWECLGTVTVEDVKAEARADAIEDAKKYIHKAIAHDGRNGWSAETWEHYIMVCLEQLKEQN